MPEKKWFWNDITDGLLRRLYDPTVRGRSQEIAARLKVPRWAVNRRAAALGLSRPKDRPWSAEDEAYVEASFHHTSVKTLARKLGRSPTAVQLKAKRLGLRKYAEATPPSRWPRPWASTRTGCWPASGRASCGPRVATPSAPPNRAATAGSSPTRRS